MWFVIFLSTTCTTARSNSVACLKRNQQTWSFWWCRGFWSFQMVSSMLPADLQSLCATLQSGYYRNSQQHTAWSSCFEGYSWFYWLDRFKKKKTQTEDIKNWRGWAGLRLRKSEEDSVEAGQVNKSVRLVLTYSTRCHFWALIQIISRVLQVQVKPGLRMVPEQRYQLV